MFGSWKISCVSLDLEESDCRSDFKCHLEHPLCTTDCLLPKTSHLTSVDGVHWRGHGTNADANHSANICAVRYGAPRYDGLIIFNLVANCKRSVLKSFQWISCTFGISRLQKCRLKNSTLLYKVNMKKTSPEKSSQRLVDST